jgi:type I restriction enzyme R subunit
MNHSEEWNEFHLSEKPAYELLRDKLGYLFVEGTQDQYCDPKNELLSEEERDSYKQVVLEKRLAQAVKRINPWIDDHNLARVVRRFTSVVASGVMEANMKVYIDLVHNIAVEQDVGAGKKNQTVKIIDFETPENNEFLVVRQLKIWGPKENIKPDLIIFVNGLPVATIECKSPVINEPIEKGVTQLLRYQDKDIGAPQLFYYNQILVSACGQAAECSTIGAARRHFHAWRDPWPYTEEQIAKILGKKSTPQDVILFGVFDKRSLLDLIQNFIVFDPENGVMVKKLARYQQFRTVNKALERVRTAKSLRERGGIVWHWQGSGKSLTMLWLAVKLRRETRLRNPALVIVTDRIQLDNQISGTFERCGFPNPGHAENSEELRQLLKTGSGQTVLTTVQKFLTRTGEKKGEFPILSASKDVFVLVDEAHRSQYRDFAANMRQALPNACYFAFTGTPIDKKDRSTPATFGNYIDKYTIEQSVEDNATVPIFYESRLPQLMVEGESIDKIFERVFAELSEKERRDLKKRYANEQAITGAPQRVEKICLNILDHYEKFIKPNGFKAQIVAIDRKTAVLYKKTLDRLKGPDSAVIISGGPDDPEDMRIYPRTQEERDLLVERFKQPMEKDSLSLIVVCDMLLTGFDAPVEQVMYLDSPLKEHNLLQAIARVNRPYDKKTYGLIVDYFGVSNFLSQALDIFKAQDIKGVLRPISDQLPLLQARHRRVVSFFETVNRKELDACVAVLEPEDIRAEFEIAFKKFAESMDMIMPDPAANPYREDLKSVGKIRNAARLRFRDEQMSLSEYGIKVRRLIEECIRSTGVDPLLKPISILDKDFKRQVQELSSDEARASEMEHALKYEIRIRREENPVYYDSLKAKLEKLIEERKERRIEMAKLLDSLRDITDEAKSVPDKAKALGLNKFEFGIFGVFQQEGLPKDALKQLTKGISKELDDLLVIDWSSKENIQREARKFIKRSLRASHCPEEKLDGVALQIMDLARVHLKK